MFRRFRQHGFALSSSLAGLLLVSLLLAAMAPCLADSHAASPAMAKQTMANHGNALSGQMQLDHGDMVGMEDMNGDCPHCDTVSSSCMDSAVDCGEQPAIFTQAPEPEKNLAVSFKVIEPPPVVRVAVTPKFPQDHTCNLSGRDRHVLFCTYQE